jgi:hypothetical protein
MNSDPCPDAGYGEVKKDPVLNRYVNTVPLVAEQAVPTDAWHLWLPVRGIVLLSKEKARGMTAAGF